MTGNQDTGISRRKKALLDVQLGGLGLLATQWALFYTVFDASLAGFVVSLPMIAIGTRWLFNPERSFDG